MVNRALKICRSNVPFLVCDSTIQAPTIPHAGIPVGQQHLIWQNGELSDDQSLRDCSIPGGATLRLVLGLRGGPINATYRSSTMSTAAAAATIRFTPIRLPPQASGVTRRPMPRSSGEAGTSAVADSSRGPINSAGDRLPATSVEDASLLDKTVMSEPTKQPKHSSIIAPPATPSTSGVTASRKQQITFYIVNSGSENSLDLLLIIDG